MLSSSSVDNVETANYITVFMKTSRWLPPTQQKDTLSPSHDSCTQFSQTLVLKFAQAAFAAACFWDLSDIHEWQGDLLKAPSPLDK